jgi:putative molybdopterin biosynthesis protein
MRKIATIRLVPEVIWRRSEGGAAPLDGRLLALLAAISRHATLRAAAREIGLSYRAAWGLLGDTGRLLGVPLVALRQGRGAELSEAGTRLLAANRRALQRLHENNVAVELDVRVLRPHKPSRTGLVLAASHDLLLAALCDRWAKPEGVIDEVTFKGSLESLKALAQGDTEVAGFHVAMPVDDAVGESFKGLLDARRYALIRFAEREQGLIVRKGNPKRLRSLADVAAQRARFVNRQRGSGTRLLIDQLLRQGQVMPESLRGYGTEEYTHLAVAATVAAGQADAGFGLKAAASRLRLDFVPLRRETYWLALRSRRLDSDAARRLREGLSGDPLRRAARGLVGYSIKNAGAVVPVTAAMV